MRPYFIPASQPHICEDFGPCACQALAILPLSSTLPDQSVVTLCTRHVHDDWKRASFDYAASSPASVDTHATDLLTPAAVQFDADKRTERYYSQIDERSVVVFYSASGLNDCRQDVG